MAATRREAGDRFSPFLAYVATFHLLWIAWPVFVYPRLLAVGDRTLAYAALNISLRLLVWVVPVLAYLRYVDGVEPLNYLKLRSHVARGLGVALVLTAINLLGSLARFGVPHVSLERVTWNSVLGTSFLVGFIEEIPYRGFMLQKFAARTGFWPANLITSLLFLPCTCRAGSRSASCEPPRWSPCSSSASCWPPPSGTPIRCGRQSSRTARTTASRS
jgi:membrane protease YdiL (CAAX protease family)